MKPTTLTITAPDANGETVLAQRAREMVESRAIESESDLSWANTSLLAIKQRQKQWEDAEKSITGPINDALRNTRAHFAPAKAHYIQAEFILKQKIGAWHLSRRELQISQMQALAPVAPPPPQTAGVGVRMVRKWRVRDADKVPRQFCSPDPDKITAHVAGGGLEAIPGIEFYDEPVVRASRNG